MEDATAVNCTSEIAANCSEEEFDALKTGSLIIIFITSLLGNFSTIAIISRFKVYKVPDVLVIGLACTDLVATFIPVPMSTYAYITLQDFSSFACDFYATVAQFTRFSSGLIVTIVSVERYFAVNRPFLYRRYATPQRFVYILFFCWVAAFALAVAPSLDSKIEVTQHDGYCLFDFTSFFTIAVLIYAVSCFIVVVTCFTLVIINLIKVYHRRKKMQVQAKFKSSSSARQRGGDARPRLTSRISDLGKSLRRAGPVISEKFSLGVEAQFAGMFFAVVALFYINWTTVLTLAFIALINRTEEGLSTALFWGIRLTVISTAINPLLYSLLARQYRLAYIYVLRLTFSKCCSCISPPLKDEFAAARNPGGEYHGETRRQALRRRKVSTITEEDGSTGLYHQKSVQDECLSVIMESTTTDHSLYTHSSEELTSSGVLLHAVRAEDRRGGSHQQEFRSYSVDDLTRLQPVHPCVHGSLNPLAIIVDVHGEKAVVENEEEEGQGRGKELRSALGLVPIENRVGSQHKAQSTPFSLDQSSSNSATFLLTLSSCSPSVAESPLLQSDNRDTSPPMIDSEKQERSPEGIEGIESFTKVDTRSPEPSLEAGWGTRVTDSTPVQAQRRHSAYLECESREGEWRSAAVRSRPFSAALGQADSPLPSFLSLAKPAEQCRHSSDNSDSGRESMVFEQDHVVESASAL